MYNAAMRMALVAVVLCSIVGCGSKRDNNGDAGGGDTKMADACVGLQCRVVDCMSQGKPNTTLSGTVFAPNGTLALYGATVYVPNLDPPPFAQGAGCDRCDPNLPGDPVTRTTSDESGHFQLDNVPAGSDVPLIISIGKWRRRVTIPTVESCTDNPLPATKTSLPKNHLEGDLPQIAITTGGCDALECLVRRLGVSDGEFGTAGGTQRVHLYSGTGGAAMLANGSAMAPAAGLWGSVDNLKKYDQVLMSCECGQDATNKPQAAMDAMKAYADLGGRVFGSHYHNVWIGGETGVATHAPAVWKDVATWGDGFASPTTDTIDIVSNPKGAAFASWMVHVMGSSVSGQFPIQSGTGRQTCNTMDTTRAEQWVYNAAYPQMFQFTTPLEMPKEMRCGKVVFTDMHVAGDSSSSGMFPSGCSISPLTPQEKALAFMLFDIASCVNPIF